MAKFSGYIGAYTEGGKSTGIYYFSMDSGLIEDLRPAAESRNPSYLALSPSKRFLYAVNELDRHEEGPGGTLSAYALREDGTLKFLNRVGSGGKGPCHVCVHGGGAFVVVSNYSGGVLAVISAGKNGRLGRPLQIIPYRGTGPNKARQEKAHAHSFTFSPDFSNGFACDLGSDKVMLYRADPKAKAPLIPWERPFVPALPGYGPRHGVFHPKGKTAYVLNELVSSVDVFSFSGGPGSGGKVPGGKAPGGKAPGPSFERVQTLSSLPRGRAGGTGESSAAAIRISPDGRFIYASNRGHDSIAVFKVLASGLLELAGIVPSGGKHPRDFALDPAGDFLLALNKDSDNLVVFKVNRRTGLLKREREYPVLSPASVIFK